MKTEIINPVNVQHGDTIIIDNKEYTIHRNDIRNCPLLGLTIRGCRMKTVERVLFLKWNFGQGVCYQPQV